MGNDTGNRGANTNQRRGLEGAMTLKDAIKMGEYNPSYLSNFPEWHTLSRHTQFQNIRKALDNRRKHLITQYAETINILDFSKKPELKEAVDNVMKQIEQLEKDREKLYLEYSK